MSRTAVARKPKPKSKAPKAKSVARITPAIAQPPGELKMLPLASIAPSPNNPRKIFDDAELQELAESIAGSGLLQPLLVRPNADGSSWELIAGERRWRASQLAGLVEIECKVAQLTDAEVVLARLTENLQRTNLTPIEEAEAFQAALLELDCTQVDFARRLGISEGQVSNRLRLLGLPQLWRNRLVVGEITASQARDVILPWADLPDVLQGIEDELKDHDEGEERNLKDVADRVAYDSSIGLNGNREINGQFQAYEIELTPEIRTRFDVREVTSYWGQTTPRAFKRDKFLAYLEVAYPAKKSRKAKDLDEGDPDVQAPKSRTPDEEKAIYTKRLYRYQIAWLQERIKEKVKSLTLTDVLRFMCATALCNGSSNRRDRMWAAIQEVTTKKVKDSWGDGPVWAAIYAVDDKQLLPVIRHFIGEWCDLQSKSFSSDADPGAVEVVAQALEIDFTKSWQLDRTFLHLHTIEQLQALHKEWKLPDAGVLTVMKKQWVDALMDHAAKVKLPKCLANLKPCSLD